MILAGSMMGYLDPLFVLPAAGALFAATEGWTVSSDVLIAIATWTKPQGLILVPAVMLTAWAAGNWRDGVSRMLAATARLVFGTGMSVAPVVAAGGWPSMALSLSRLGHHDIDLTVVGALVNCAVFVWHAIVLKRECAAAS